jgi:hypothetical protein
MERRPASKGGALKLPDAQAKGQRAKSDHIERQEEDVVILYLPYRNVARYANGEEEWPEPFPRKPLEARAMITAIQGLTASQKRSKEVQAFLTYRRQTVASLAESLRAWREVLSASGLSVSTVNRKLSAVERTIRTATAGADATVRGAIEAILSAAVHAK